MDDEKFIAKIPVKGGIEDLKEAMLVVAFEGGACIKDVYWDEAKAVYIIESEHVDMDDLVEIRDAVDKVLARKASEDESRFDSSALWMAYNNAALASGLSIREETYAWLFKSDASEALRSEILKLMDMMLGELVRLATMRDPGPSAQLLEACIVHTPYHYLRNEEGLDD